MLDFLPEDDKLDAPLGEMATLPENDILRFVLVKKKLARLVEQWVIPDKK